MENFILKSRDAADQLERASYTAFSYLEKYKAIIETILDPRFINGTEYPTNWADVPYYNFTTLPESQKTGNRSYSQITYSAPGEVTSSTHDFIKKMSSLNEQWVELKDWDIGLEHSFNQARLWIIYIDPQDSCSIAVMTYPGQEVFFDSSMYTEYGCLDLRRRFPYIYDNRNVR